jgi:hypothetical protein
MHHLYPFRSSNADVSSSLARGYGRSEMEGRPSRAWYLLLALPVLGLLYPPLYARHDPELFGFPFFYWYQFAWVLGAAALTLIVYRATKPET